MAIYPDVPDVELDPIVQQVNPGPEQRPAVMARGADVVVHAGAGTGKTRTLISRFLALVAEGNPLRSVVAVTFTDKAALEMRSRLRAAIRTYLDDPSLPAERRAAWEQTERDLDSARIGTIHSLCSEILRRHPAEAVIDPQFSVLDDAQALLLRTNALDDALASAVVDDKYAPLFAVKKVDAVRTLLAALLDRRLALADALGDEAEVGVRTRVDELRARVRDLMCDGDLLETFEALRTCNAYAQEHVQAAADAAAPVVRNSVAICAAALAAADRGDWAASGTALSALAATMKDVGRNANWSETKPKMVFKQIRQILTKSLGDDVLDPAADLRLLELRPLVHTLYAEASARYAAAKDELRALDFDDLEAGALALLRSHPAVRAEWQQQVAALLVDEFQDTNARQAELVRLLGSAPGRLFVVGDAQQSIYGFRGADLRVFHAERDRIDAAGGALATLDRSYRTHPALLNALEKLLRPIFDDGPEADYRARFSPLRAAREEAAFALSPPFIEFHLAEGAKADAMPCAADALAKRLYALHSTGVAWGDIAILCRASKAFTWYEDALERAGIPNVTVAGRGFYERPEVRDILNALRAVTDPHDNLALIGLLRSPAVGMSDLAIMRLCDAAPKGSRNAPEPGAIWLQLQREGDPLALDACVLVRDLHALAGRVTVAELLGTLLERSTYAAALLQAGQTRAARNLTKIMDEAQAAPSPSVNDFLARIDALRSATTREGEARADESGAVQIMTVHSAKGLEFPVVVIGDAGNRGSNRGDVVYIDEQLGILFSVKEDDGVEGFLFAEAKRRAREREEAESERILYVAATRARDLLIFSGDVTRTKQDECNASGWLKAMTADTDLKQVLNGALADSGALKSSACGTYACAIHKPAPASRAAAAGAAAALAQEAAADDALGAAVWDARLIASLPGSLAPATPKARAWRVVPELDDTRAPAWVTGQIVHEAIAAWRFPDDSDAAPAFDDWAAARARSCGVHVPEARARVVFECRRLLMRLRAHPLHAALAGAPRRFSELPYQYAGADGAAEGGRMDVLFQRPDGGWTVLDFKTNTVTANRTIANIVEREHYDVDLRRYGRAVEQLLRVRPELALCFLDTPEGLQLHPLSFDAA